MKHILLILIISLSFASCLSSKDYDKELYDCWRKCYSDLGFDIEDEFKNFETKLISNGYLKDSNYNSYVDFICNYSDSLINIYDLKELPSIDYTGNFKVCPCGDTLSDFRLFISDYFRIYKTGINEKELKESLSEEKFINYPIYKTWILLNVYLQIQTRYQFANVLRELAQTNNSSDEIVTDTIYIMGHSTIQLNNVEFPDKDLSRKAKGLRKVILKADVNTIVGRVLAVQDTLKGMGIEVVIK